MKLDDARLQALVEAYREQQRPSSAQRAAMLARLHAAQRPWFLRWPAVAGVSAAAAAAVIAWLAVRGPEGSARDDTKRSGVQAPFDAEPGPADAAIERGAAGERGTATKRAGDDASSPGSTTEPSPTTTSERSRPPDPVQPRSTGPDPRDRVAREPNPSEPGPTEPSPPSVDEEVRLIEAAEAALRSSHPERALELLDRHQREYPHGTTTEERRALRILALCAQGRTAEGRGARFSFLRDYPESAYRTRIDKACPRP